jgi:hypothetical protein
MSERQIQALLVQLKLAKEHHASHMYAFIDHPSIFHVLLEMIFMIM